jgi:hypothetical protein
MLSGRDVYMKIAIKRHSNEELVLTSYNTKYTVMEDDNP